MCKLYTHVFLHHALSRRYDPIPAQKAMKCKSLRQHAAAAMPWLQSTTLVRQLLQQNTYYRRLVTTAVRTHCSTVRHIEVSSYATVYYQNTFHH